jgi:IS5 family transposase
MQLVLSIAKDRLADEPLLFVSGVIQWDAVDQHMQADYWRSTFRKGGRTPYDYRAMFRALLIARWYGLSYPKMERALRVRLDFLLFCGFDGSAKLPDASTLNRFNGRLTNGNVKANMIEEVERQLYAMGFVLLPAKGALLDIGFK